MKTITRAVLGVAFTVAVAFAAVRASETNLPPSNHTADIENAAHKSNAEEISGQNSTQGRFRIVSGQTWFLSEKEGGATKLEMPVMLKLDTQTGKAWVLVMRSSVSNGTTMGFAELPDVKHN